MSKDKKVPPIEIDKDKLVASDIKKNIKIILIKDNVTNYSIIQEIKSKED